MPPHIVPLPDEAATATLAQCVARCGPLLLGQLRIDLQGDLGAGKTTWVRHLLRALGVQGRIKSPTYALLESYSLPTLPFEILHFDLYRLDGEQEWLDSGLQESAQGPGLRLIEWPQKAGNALGQPDLQLTFEQAHTPTGQRQLQLRAYSSIGSQVLENVLKCAP